MSTAVAPMLPHATGPVSDIALGRRSSDPEVKRHLGRTRASRAATAMGAGMNREVVAA
jgi:hypothetical protein